MKKMLLVLLAFVLAVAGFYGRLVYQNNRQAPVPDQAEIRQGFERSIGWLQANEDKVLADRNPMLWWMIEQAAQLTHDTRLNDLYSKYLASRAPGEANSVSQFFVSPQKYWGSHFPEYSYSNYGAYQRYLLYGISCSRDFAEQEEIDRQKDVSYCGKHDSTPACLTHQLMAFRFMQRYGCDRIADLPDRVQILQQKIISKLVRDPRVIDVYIQRVLMLVDSGAAAKIKPIWIKNILQAQLADGSWSGKQPLLRIGSLTLSFADLWYALYPGEVRGTFHATAQGVWLMSLLQQKDHYAALATSTS